MHDFDLNEFSALINNLTRYYWIAVHRNENAEVEDQNVQMLSGIAGRMAAVTTTLSLEATYARVMSSFTASLTCYGKPKWGKIKDQIAVLLETLAPELSKRRFAYIAADKCSFLESILSEEHTLFRDAREPDPAWLNIWKRFPSSREDCEEAVYCYALERNIACVFHSMRIAEIGLRSLARRMAVRLPKGKRLEWGEWQAILREMNKKTDTIGQTAKAGPAKDEILEFYNGAIGQFNGFKDEFRNQVMHVRKSYNEFEAASALTRVRDFMAKLASRIDEKGRRVKA